MEGLGMNTPVALKDFEKEKLFAVPDLVGKIFAESKSLAHTNKAHPASQLRAAIRAVLHKHLDDEEFINKVMHSDEYGKLLYAVNSQLAQEQRQDKDATYIVHHGTPGTKPSHRQDLKDEGRNFVVRQRNITPNEVKRALREPEAPELVRGEDGQWIQKDLL